jgi:hypothetical protein
VLRTGPLNYDVEQVGEGNLFVARGLPADWVARFFDVMESVDVLKKFHSDLAALGGTAASEGVISATLNEHLRHASGAPQRLGPVPDVLESFLSQLTSSLDSDPLTRDGVLNVELQRQLSEVGMHQFIVEDLLPALFAVVPPAELTGLWPGTLARDFNSAGDTQNPGGGPGLWPAVRRAVAEDGEAAVPSAVGSGQEKRTQRALALWAAVVPDEPHSFGLQRRPRDSGGLLG